MYSTVWPRLFLQWKQHRLRHDHMIAWQAIIHCMNLKKLSKRKEYNRSKNIQLLFWVKVIFEKVSHFLVLPEATLYAKLCARERLCRRDGSHLAHPSNFLESGKEYDGLWRDNSLTSKLDAKKTGHTYLSHLSQIVITTAFLEGRQTNSIYMSLHISTDMPLIPSSKQQSNSEIKACQH